MSRSNSSQMVPPIMWDTSQASGMIQFQRLTNHVGVAVEVSSPKAVMQFNDWLRFLPIRRIGRAEIPAEQRRDAQRRKGLPNSVVSVHRFGYVAARHRQVLVTPGSNVLEGGKLGYRLALSAAIANSSLMNRKRLQYEPYSASFCAWGLFTICKTGCARKTSKADLAITFFVVRST